MAMIDRQRRKSLVSEYRDVPVVAGIFAVRCASTGQVWVGPSRNLANQQNGIWFTLKLGSHPNRAAQAAWAAHGPDGFTYDVLETIEDKDLTPYLLASLLKEKLQGWREVLTATNLTG